jgi:hypothetical protein
MSTEQAGAVVVAVDAADFALLCEESLEWGSWDRPAGRFEALENGTGGTGRPWRRIYWLGERYTAVIFARAFLLARGFEYEILWDNAEHPNGQSLGYVILTDYEGP